MTKKKPTVPAPSKPIEADRQRIITNQKDKPKVR